MDTKSREQRRGKEKAENAHRSTDLSQKLVERQKIGGKENKDKPYTSLQVHRTKGIFVCEKDNCVDNSRDYHHRLSGIVRIITFHPGKQNIRFTKARRKEKNTRSVAGESIL